MIKLRTQINNLLKTYHPQVHFQKAPDTAKMPYIVFDFPNSFDNENQEVFSFDIDIWDDKNDTTALETLASSLWKGLNYYRYTDADIQFSIYRENRLPPLDEEEINVKRRKLIFQVRYFDRNLL